MIKTAEKNNNFHISEQMDSKESYNLNCILELLNKILSEIFGEDIMQKEGCIINNEPEAGYPKLYYQPLRIRLALQTTAKWNQLVYQLSHELCHYVIRVNNNNIDCKLKRFEEILCEAFSLYILTVVSQRWEESELSELDFNYRDSLISYFQIEYANGEGHNISKEMTIKEYIIDNINCESNREGHIAERNYLLSLFREHPDKISEIIQYTRYIKSDKSLLIDFDLWSSNTINKSFVNDLSVVQPQII